MPGSIYYVDTNLESYILSANSEMYDVYILDFSADFVEKIAGPAAIRRRNGYILIHALPGREIHIRLEWPGRELRLALINGTVFPVCLS